MIPNVNLDVWVENKTLSGSSGVSKVNNKLLKPSFDMFMETGNFIPNMAVGAAEGVNRLNAVKTTISGSVSLVTEVKNEVKKTTTVFNRDSTSQHSVPQGNEHLIPDDYNDEF